MRTRGLLAFGLLAVSLPSLPSSAQHANPTSRPQFHVDRSFPPASADPRRDMPQGFAREALAEVSDQALRQLGRRFCRGNESVVFDQAHQPWKARVGGVYPKPNPSTLALRLQCVAPGPARGIDPRFTVEEVNRLLQQELDGWTFDRLDDGSWTFTNFVIFERREGGVAFTRLAPKYVAEYQSARDVANMVANRTDAPLITCNGMSLADEPGDHRLIGEVVSVSENGLEILAQLDANLTVARSALERGACHLGGHYLGGIRQAAAMYAEEHPDAKRALVITHLELGLLWVDHPAVYPGYPADEFLHNAVYELCVARRVDRTLYERALHDRPTTALQREALRRTDAAGDAPCRNTRSGEDSITDLFL